MSSQTFGNGTFYGLIEDYNQIVVDLDKEFIRNPNMNLVIAVRDIKANSNNPSTHF